MLKLSHDSLLIQLLLFLFILFISFLSFFADFFNLRTLTGGVPIPALLCGQCHRGYTSKNFALKVADLLETRGGIEFYWEHLVSARSFSELCNRFTSLFDPTLDFTCPHCGRNALSETETLGVNLCTKEGTRLEKDIFDVWFDSGVASFARRHSDNNNMAQVQMLCEGQDQHRGWYQALLFCSLVLEGQVPSTSFLTHSFVVGQDKKKLSKSTTTPTNNSDHNGHNNTPQPQPQQPSYLAHNDTVVGRPPDHFCGDMLRLWACSSKYASNVIMSDELYRVLRKKYMLLRHTSWFILANLADFSLRDNHIPVRALFPYDRFALSVLQRVEAKVHQAYESHDFATVCSLLLDYTQKVSGSFSVFI